MSLRVPNQQVDYIKKLLELSDEQIAALLTAFREVEPQFNTFDLAARVSRFTKLPYELVSGIVQVLASIYLTVGWTRSDESVEGFIDKEVFTSLRRENAFSSGKEDVEWQRFRAFLVSALSLERTVGTSIKAGHVMTTHEHIFKGARIMTDLRPIFHLDVSEKPDAAIIVHMLKISERDDYGEKTDTFYALDSNDIASLKLVVERAIRKEETLKALMEDSGVIVIAPKFFF